MITVVAPAKINLFLRICGKIDAGYHLLDSAIVFTRFGDHLTIEPADDDQLAITGEFGTDEESVSWEEMITECLRAGLWVTLDYDVRFHNWILENGFNEHEQFISMISVKLPYIEQLNYNACIKIDDENFRATNPGVWVYYAQELKDRKKFTSWEDYGKDQPIILDSEH